MKESKKRHLPTISRGVLKYTKECNPSNAVPYCGEFYSILLSVCELERREKKKRQNAENVLGFFHALACVRAERLALSGM